jgi:hypothetical protein
VDRPQVGAPLTPQNARRLACRRQERDGADVHGNSGYQCALAGPSSLDRLQAQDWHGAIARVIVAGAMPVVRGVAVSVRSVSNTAFLHIKSEADACISRRARK